MRASARTLSMALVALIVLGGALIAPSPVVALGYNDSFEQTALGPGWQTTTQFGAISLSTEQAHSGAQSVKLSSTDGYQREIHLTRYLSSPVEGTASIWFYDTAPGQATLYSRFILSAGSDFVAGVYIQDYDGGYYYAAGGGVGGGPTSVQRSAGWHHFEIDTALGQIRIDGVEVVAFPGGLAFDNIDLNLTGPGGRPNAVYYFDDLSVVPAVSYTFEGFYRPVDNLDMVNIAKAGQAISFKWSLRDAGGSDVTDLAAVTSYGFGELSSCSGTTDKIEEYASTGATSLRYDEEANQFVLTAQTSKSWAGTCKMFTLVLADGTMHQARFSFTR